jgi:hypothetical protein
MNSRDDVKCFAAVATSLNSFYPDADRSKNLYNIVIKGMRNTRHVTPAEPQRPVAEVSEAGLIDFGLKDMKGVERRPSQLKGKVVLIDFTIYQSAVSTSHNYTLRDLYTSITSRDSRFTRYRSMPTSIIGKPWPTTCLGFVSATRTAFIRHCSIPTMCGTCRLCFWSTATTS